MFLNDWEGCDKTTLAKDFAISETDLDGCEILLASYGEMYGWDGQAFVLFRKNGKLFEVTASHCSCFGLEDQWEPEETTRDDLQHRLSKGSLGRDGDHNYSEELNQIIVNL